MLRPQGLPMALKVVETQQSEPLGARVTGAAMDQPLPKRRPNYPVWGAGALLLLAGLAVIYQLLPHGLRVARSDLRIATVQQGMFHNDVVVRARAEPLHTIMLDVLESGRVEEILVNDGAQVAKGALLFRLSNPQRRLDLVAREADRAQQISNLSELRVLVETSQTEHQRRLLELDFALAQAERQYTRSTSLVETGVISVADFEDIRDRVEQQRRALADEKRRAAIELRIKQDGVRQMEQAIQQLDAGLKVVNESIDALAVRAPIAGRLTDFRLQLGEIVKAEQRVGRIDDPSQFKLTAQIDEFFLGSVLPGKEGLVNVNARQYPVAVSRVFPQIKDGRFSAELLFTGDAPAEMSPGQSAELRITLGSARPALILPNDAFLADTGGAWAFVLTEDGGSAERRKIRIGRRNTSQVEVISDLAAGERVIVSTYAAFGDADRLQIAQ
ncbi:MAG TPA: HlyD family efflux transporter periplasmic adaptor subunit [Steroidobacter sp.]|uniref:efflux RND transporter periplasmic adaptor subunit n=1 Tax=Steroidobacter sp. TaxID=1978227 RepID=UPI002EDAD3D7